MQREKIEKRLQKELDEDRFRHTQGVMYTAAALAMRYGYDVEQALYAGLLHDCAKCISNSERLALCEKHGIEISQSERENPFLLHAKVGALLAEREYGIKDEKILHAIAVHTTGCPNMSVLDKMIYIADYIEPNRKEAPNLKEIREMAFENLEMALLKILKDTLSYLDNSKKAIDPMTMQTYLFYKEGNHETGN